MAVASGSSPMGPSGDYVARLRDEISADDYFGRLRVEARGRPRFVVQADHWFCWTWVVSVPACDGWATGSSVSRWWARRQATRALVRMVREWEGGRRG